MIDLGRTEEVIRDMDKLVVPTRCPQGIALTSKKRCQPCVASRMQRIKLITKIGGKALPHHGGKSKIPGGIPHLRHPRDDGLDTDEAVELARKQ